MKRLLLIAAIAFLGAASYLTDPPALPAREAKTSGETPAVTAAAQSEVVRLTEASLSQRRLEVPQAAAYAGPRPETLFGRK
ncbi:hypothetical protein [Desulfovibrio sp. TomC]|uniref:hypothetical protein n=1 Tax=Desulfovibrio sp. TomC TaxID=1562888 RepID=UPI0005B8EF32|nr:hypothetical protein [Desulfovibrio sp. TomC]